MLQQTTEDGENMKYKVECQILALTRGFLRDWVGNVQKIIAALLQRDGDKSDGKESVNSSMNAVYINTALTRCAALWKESEPTQCSRVAQCKTG